MWYYIVAFSISLIGIYLANLAYKNKWLFCFFSIIGLLPPILIAGFRNHTVGADTDFYILPIFYQATSYFTNVKELIEANPNTDFLCLYYTWFVTRLTQDSYIYLSLNHILIFLPLYITAYKLRKYLSPVVFFLLYYLIFYQESLSIVRQSIAISFSMLAFVFYLERKLKLYFCLMAIAFGFHSTVIITLLYPLVLKYLKKYPLNENNKKYSFFIILGVFVVINLNFLLMFLINAGVLNMKYLIYTAQSDTFKGGLGVTNFIIKIVIIFFIYCFRKKHKSSIFYDFAFVLSILDLIFCLCALLVEPLDRFSLYPRLMSCITLPVLFNVCQKEKLYSLVRLKYILVCLLCFFWYYVYIQGDYDSTSDYKMNSKIVLI